MIRILIATRNRHKVGEIQDMLRGVAECCALDGFDGAPQVAETGETFVENATLKAEAIARWIEGKPEGRGITHVLADDSGLEVDALGGAPGVHSARFAALDSVGGGNSPDADNNAKLLRLLAGVPLGGRQARFRCVVAFAAVAEEAASAKPAATQVFDGRCEGRIDLLPRGTGGFGYDPLFIPEGENRSFAELGEEVKNRISHRARAIAALLEFLRQPR